MYYNHTLYYPTSSGGPTAPLQMTADQFDEKSLFSKMEHGSPFLYHGVLGPGTPPVYIVPASNKKTKEAPPPPPPPEPVKETPPPPPVEKEEEEEKVSILVDVPGFTDIVYPAVSSDGMAENILHAMEGENSFLAQSVTSS